MRTIRTLHLYRDLLDLNGDGKNVTALRRRILESENDCRIDYMGLEDELDITEYDLIYIGHGKTKNLAAAAAHFTKYGEHIKEQIENGKTFFVTGNGRELFGKSFTDTCGSTLPGIGLFDYVGVEKNEVFVSDMIGHPIFDENEMIYVFGNRTAYLEGENKHPLIKVVEGFGDNQKPDGFEGTLYKNFFGTWGVGPVLARNPALMREVLKRCLGDDYIEGDYSLEERALALVLEEFDS